MRIACLLAGLLLVGCGAPDRGHQASDRELQKYAREGAVVLDVRTPQEYAAGHVTGATNVPVDEVAGRIGAIVPNREAPVLVHCRSGRRSAQASQTLKDMGYTRVYDLGSLPHAREVTAAAP